MHAIRQQLDGFVRADLLIEAAVRAVALGVESPSLYELAGLARREEPEAQEVFRRVTDELQTASSDLAEGSSPAGVVYEVDPSVGRVVRL